MVFRVFLATLTAAALACLVWVARHESLDPVVLGRYSRSYASLVLLCLLLFVALCVAHVPFVYRRLYERRAALVLLITTVALGLIGMEVAVRVIDPLGISYYEYYTRFALDMKADPDPDVAFLNTPGLERRYGDFEVAINEMGFRDRPLTPKNSETFRILCMGDSVTFGWGVSAEDTFCERLERKLSAWRGQPVDVVNTGVVGYNTVQELGLFERHVDSLEPDLALLLYVANDIARATYPYDPAAELSFEGKNPQQTIRLLLGKAWTYRLFWHLSVFGAGPRHWKRPDRLSRDWQRSMDSLRRLAGDCRARGIPFVLFYLDRDESAVGTETLWQDVSGVARAAGAHVCATRGWWPDSPTADFSNSVIDRHPNPAGHEVLATGMQRFLLEEGLVPPGAGRHP